MDMELIMGVIKIIVLGLLFIPMLAVVVILAMLFVLALGVVCWEIMRRLRRKR